MSKVLSKETKTKKSLVVGKHVDDHGNRLRPGKKVIFWTGDSASGVNPCPALLSKKSPTTGNWSVSYMQYERWAFAAAADYSTFPKLHCWTFAEVYDEWEAKQVYPLEK